VCGWHFIAVAQFADANLPPPRAQRTLTASGRIPVGTTAAASLTVQFSNSEPSKVLLGVVEFRLVVCGGFDSAEPECAELISRPPRRKTIANPALRSGRSHCHAHQTSSPAGFIVSG